jgi:hypothetical protein
VHSWLKPAVTATPPHGSTPMQHAGHTIGIYRREGGRMGAGAGSKISWFELPARLDLLCTQAHNRPEEERV